MKRSALERGMETEKNTHTYMRMNINERMKNCVYKRENMNMNENENQGVDRSYVDWDLIPFHRSLNSSEKLPTQKC